MIKLELHKQGFVKDKPVKDEIEKLRTKLYQLICDMKNFNLSDEVISISQDLDKLICAYYKAEQNNMKPTNCI